MDSVVIDTSVLTVHETCARPVRWLELNDRRSPLLVDSIEIDDLERPEKVTVSFYRHGSADLSALPTSSQAYAELMDCLPGSGLKFTGSTAGNLSKISVKPFVPVELRLVADIPGAAIRIFLRNVEDLGDGPTEL